MISLFQAKTSVIKWSDPIRHFFNKTKLKNLKIPDNVATCTCKQTNKNTTTRTQGKKVSIKWSNQRLWKRQIPRKHNMLDYSALGVKTTHIKMKASAACWWKEAKTGKNEDKRISKDFKERKGRNTYIQSDNASYRRWTRAQGHTGSHRQT